MKGTCRFSVGKDSQTGLHTLCRAPVQKGETLCDGHNEVAFCLLGDALPRIQRGKFWGARGRQTSKKPRRT